MTAVYRAYSPSRNEGTTVTDTHSYAAGVAGTRNQLCAAHPDHTPDWVVQAGHVEWETP